MRIVESAGVTVAFDLESEGAYIVTAWCKFKEGGFGQTQCYRNLSWYEASDCVNAVLADLRPGRDLSEDFEQIPMW